MKKLLLLLLLLLAPALTFGAPINTLQGGTGLSSAPALGQFLIGNTGSKYQLISTSALFWGATSQYPSGAFGIGTSTPWARFSLVTGTTAGPALIIATTSPISVTAPPLLYITSTTTGASSYVRFMVGTSTQGDSGARDQFFVDGRINTSWLMSGGDTTSCVSPTAVVSNVNNACNGMAFFESTDGAIDSHVNGLGALRLRASTGGNLALGEGACLGSGGQIDITLAQEPVFETVARATSGTASHRVELGITDRTSTTGTGVEPTNGVYFRVVDGANWIAVTRSGGSETSTDTGIAVSSTNFARFRIEASTTTAVFIISNVVVAVHSTDLPTGASLGFGANTTLINSTAPGVRNLDLKRLQVWRKEL